MRHDIIQCTKYSLSSSISFILLVMMDAHDSEFKPTDTLTREIYALTLFHFLFPTPLLVGNR